jgi:hypothetical protein
MLATDALEVDQESPVVLKHKDRELKAFAVKKEQKKRKILLLGSSHGREIDFILQENQGTKFDVCSIFKPNASLAKVVENIAKLGKDTKHDHVVIVEGPGNSLELHYHYALFS